ncbi:tetratricopeptide repeat protein [Actinoplanes sp. NPDC020271]|uniref:tetratricopeptide repeat protein n=1 Tax=Actinoplanes sp. NPDC020271 TaxID=3363896 RepID=UPI0037B1F46D
MSTQGDVQVVVLTALPVEYDAVRRHLRDHVGRRHPVGTQFEVGTLPDGGRVAVAELGPGNLGAAVVTGHAIEMFQPRAILFVGIAGALHGDLQLGDVVVATKVYSYHGGIAMDEDFLARPQAYDGDWGLVQSARAVARARRAAPDSPTVHSRPVASGEVVLNSRTQPLAELLNRNYNDAAAIEMESAGMVRACQMHQLPALVIRGISDLADGAKEEADAEGSQPVAARNAADVAVAVIADYLSASNGQATTTLEQPAPAPFPTGITAPERVPTPLWLIDIPRPPADPFVGRQAELDLLDQQLHHQRAPVVTQAIFGLGGVGKSELALQYATRHADRYPLIWWAAADNDDSLQESLADLARRLEPAHAQHATTTVHAASWALQWLQSHQGWLLILDDVEERATVAPVLGQVCRHGSVIITTRRDINWRGSATPLPLDLLTLQASIELLRGFIGESGEPQALAELAAEVGHLPLALEQAGAYIAQQRITVARYLGLLRARPAEAFHAVDEGGEASRTIARVWDLTFTAIGGKNPQALTLLRTLAYFAADNIPRHLLSGNRANADAVDKALGLLASYSMIKLDQRHIAVHRLVAAVLREQATDEQDDDAETPAAAATSILAAAIPPGNPHIDIDTWPAWREVVPHIDALARAVPSTQATVATASLLTRSAFFASSQGQHNVALPQERQALAIVEAHLGSGHPIVASILYNLGQSLTALGKPDEALPLLQRGLAIMEAVRGPEHPDVATGLSHVARVMVELGRPADALPLRDRELAIDRAALGADHPTVAIALNNLAGTLEALGRPDEALPMREQALAISEAAYGPDHPVVAVRLGNLATALTAVGRATDALPLHERALAISEALLDKDHPDIAIRLNNLALTLEALGRPAQALPMRRRALTITEAALGPDHPTVALRLNNLAQTLNDLGNPTEALPLQQRALAISKAALGANHPTVAVQVGNLAQTIENSGRAAEALPLRHRALAITETALGPEHPDTATGLLNLAAALTSTGKPDEALPLAQRALRILEATFGPDHPTSATAAGNIGQTLYELGRAEDALPWQQRALHSLESVFGPSHPHVAGALNNLAATLVTLQRADDALPLQQRALAISEATFGPDHPILANRLSGLAVTWETLGNFERALPLLRSALKISEDALGHEHPDLVPVLANLADVLAALGKAEATSMFKRALDISCKSLGAEHPTTVAIRRHLDRDA